MEGREPFSILDRPSRDGLSSIKRDTIFQATVLISPSVVSEEIAEEKLVGSSESGAVTFDTTLGLLAPLAVRAPNFRFACIPWRHALAGSVYERAIFHSLRSAGRMSFPLPDPFQNCAKTTSRLDRLMVHLHKSGSCHDLSKRGFSGP